MTHKSIFKELSLFTPNYNHAQYLEEKIESILSFRIHPLEYLIIDDASTDNSWDIIQKYCQKYSWIKAKRNKENQGFTTNNHKLALRTCRGHIMHSTAADDLTLPGAFEKVQEAYEQYPSVGVYFGPMHRLSEDKVITETLTPNNFTENSYIAPKDFIEKYINHQSASFSLGAATYYNRKALLKIGGHPAQVRSWRDTLGTWLLALQYGAFYIHQPLAAYRYLETSISSNDTRNYENVVENIYQATLIMRLPQFKRLFPCEFVMNWAKDFLLNFATNRVFSMSKNNSTSSEILSFVENTITVLRNSPIANNISHENLKNWYVKYKSFATNHSFQYRN